MQSARSACLSFHLKLPKMLRRQNKGCLHKRARPHEVGFRGSARVGSSIWKVEPLPRVDLTQIRRAPGGWQRIGGESLPRGKA
jgi:hypothetical protein